MIGFKATATRAVLNLDKNSKRAIENSLYDIGEKIRDKIKETKRFKDRTTRLRKSILVSSINKKKLSVAIRAFQEEYATYVNNGTHNPDGSWRITPRKFMEEGSEKAMPYLPDIIINHLKRLL